MYAKIQILLLLRTCTVRVVQNLFLNLISIRNDGPKCLMILVIFGLLDSWGKYTLPDYIAKQITKTATFTVVKTMLLIISLGINIYM